VREAPTIIGHDAFGLLDLLLLVRLEKSLGKQRKEAHVEIDLHHVAQIAVVCRQHLIPAAHAYTKQRDSELKL
jgi:hypothetical protein